MKNITLPLKDGSRFSLTEYGAKGGSPFFYFHGFPGSRLEALLAHGCAAQHNIRMIAVDRPGYGGAAFRIRQNIAEWHQDVARMADLLELKQFGILGVSGGAPYALACASGLQQRVSVVGLVCGLGPTVGSEALKSMPLFQRLGLSMADRAPWLVAPLFFPAVKMLGTCPRLFLPHLVRSAGQADREALQNRELRTVLTAAITEALRPGVRGAWYDLKLYSKPWGFRLEDIQVPIWLWHGEADRIVPAAMGRQMARTLPRCTSNFLAKEGHFSLISKHMGSITATLAAAHAATLD